jgi:hypothetical protein
LVVGKDCTSKGQGQTPMERCAPAPAAPIDGQHMELADIKTQYTILYNFRIVFQ